MSLLNEIQRILGGDMKQHTVTIFFKNKLNLIDLIKTSKNLDITKLLYSLCN